MKAACMIVLLSIASCVCVSFCYPSKPLNERSTELAWEAWLLVDQSNRQGDVGLLRRRITPKSVFIAPTFSPDSLPACADGYRSDMMGRCVKIIKINESVHLDFLLQKLNAQYPDYEETTEPPKAQGPLQLNIPLPGDSADDDDDTDVAIVVAPSGKHSSKRHPDKATTVRVQGMGGDKFSVESIASLLNVKPEDVEMTTIAQLSTTVALATTMTTMSMGDETKTLPPTTTEGVTEGTTEMSTTESAESTTVLEGDALYFRV